MTSQNLVAFDDMSGFLVLDAALAENIGGGVFFSVSKGGDTKINDQCIADNKNTQCVQLNNICATNVACPEVDLPR